MHLTASIIAMASSGLFFLLGLRLGSRIKPFQAFDREPDPSVSAALRLGCYALVDVDSVLRSFFSQPDRKSVIDSEAIILGGGRELLALAAPKSDNARMRWAA